MENIIWNSDRERCENCDGHPSVRMKTKNNKTTYLSKFLFLKNPKNPNGKKIKNIGKIDNAADFIRRDMDSIGFNVLPGKIPEETCIAATE